MNLAQILIKVSEGASETVLAERQAKAEQALARALAGEDFAKLAKELSEDASKERGGEFGMRPADRLPDLFVEAVKGLGKGQVSANAAALGRRFPCAEGGGP